MPEPLISALRAHKTMFVFRTENVVVQIGDPLTTRDGQVQILYAVFDMHRDAVPEKRWIPVHQVRRRRIAELAVHSGFFEFEVERVGFARIHGIAELTRSEERRVGKECRSRWSP